MDSADLKYLASEIDDLDSTSRTVVASAVNNAGDGSVNGSSSWTSLCSAIEGLGETSVVEIMRNSGHSVSVSGFPYDIKEEIHQPDLSNHTHQDTITKEFNIYKDENGRDAVLSLIKFTAYTQAYRIFDGYIDVYDASYTIKTETGRVLQSGSMPAALYTTAIDQFGNKYHANCVPVAYTTLGSDLGNATKIIVEIKYNIRTHNVEHAFGSSTHIWFRVDDFKVYYADM